MLIGGVLELQYKDIIPKIYVEEYLENNKEHSIDEYEVYCFNGNPEFIKYTAHIEGYGMKISYITPKWEKADYNLFFESYEDIIPDNYNQDKILEYSKFLSKDFIFARVDFFEVKRKLYFGEMTFSPFMGNIKFCPNEYDFILGKKLKIK